MIATPIKAEPPADLLAARRAELQAQLQAAAAKVNPQDAYGPYDEYRRYFSARMEVMRLQDMLAYLDRAPA